MTEPALQKKGKPSGGWYVKQADDASLVGTRYNGGATITDAKRQHNLSAAVGSCWCEAGGWKGNAWLSRLQSKAES